MPSYVFDHLIFPSRAVHNHLRPSISPRTTAARRPSIDSLDDPVTRYLPDLRGFHWGPITLRHLVTPDLRRLAARARYGEPPGQRFHDNNYNVILLGMILERVAGARCRSISRRRSGSPSV